MHVLEGYSNATNRQRKRPSLMITHHNITCLSQLSVAQVRERYVPRSLNNKQYPSEQTRTKTHSPITNPTVHPSPCTHNTPNPIQNIFFSFVCVSSSWSSDRERENMNRKKDKPPIPCHELIKKAARNANCKKEKRNRIPKKKKKTKIVNQIPPPLFLNLSLPISPPNQNQSNINSLAQA